MAAISQKFFLKTSIPTNILVKTSKVFNELFEDASENNLLFAAESPEELDTIKQIAKNISQNYENVIFLGTGASYTIPKMIIDLASNSNLNFHFLRNFDEAHINYLMNKLNPKKTFIVAISKSGETIEVLTNFLKIHAWMLKNLKQEQLKERFLVVTEEKASQLFILAENIGCLNINHPNIGGRFAVLTVVGLLPALLVGLDVDKMMAASKRITAEIIQEKDSLIQAAAYNHFFSEKDFSSVLLSYGENFNGFNEWHKQLIAESLGKDNKGMIPLTSLGSYDQHIQLQLFLDGSKSLYFTILSKKPSGESEIKNKTGVRDLNYLTGLTFSEMLAKNMWVVIDLLKSKNKNIRYLELNAISEDTIVELVVRQLLELMLLAKLRGVNPFGQPAVDGIKSKIKSVLKDD